MVNEFTYLHTIATSRNKTLHRNTCTIRHTVTARAPHFPGHFPARRGTLGAILTDMTRIKTLRSARQDVATTLVRYQNCPNPYTLNEYESARKTLRSLEAEAARL